MRLVVVPGILLLCACTSGGNSVVDSADPTDTNAQPTPPGYTFECELGERDDLPDIFAETSGREHECEGQPYYIPELGTATAFFLGEFHWDDCGNLQGREYWKLWSDDRLVELGLDDCQVVWKVTGEKGPPVTQGTYSLAFAANVVTSETTCPDSMLYYPGSFTVTYDVFEAGGATTFYFADSGTLLGQGWGNDNHATYVSDLNCELLGYATL